VLPAKPLAVEERVRWSRAHPFWRPYNLAGVAAGGAGGAVDAHGHQWRPPGGVRCHYHTFDCGTERYSQQGAMMNPDGSSSWSRLVLAAGLGHPWIACSRGRSSCSAL
jgi:hypothetical protein